MIFTNQQIQEILAILQRWKLVLVCNQVGTDFLSKSDKAVLRAAGIDLKKFKNRKGIIEHSFLFGLLSEALGDVRSAQMDYNQFKRFLESGNFVPLTESEEFALNQLKQRAYTDISGLGSRIKAGTTNVIVRANLAQQNVVRDQIKKQAIKAVELRMAPADLAADLANLTEDWGRDWLRIAYYLMHEAYNTGRAQSILKAHGGEAEVYFDVFSDACKHCKELFLEDPDDPNSKPKVFKIKEVIANGNNIGRKVADWLPTVGPIHPYCRCIINYVRPGYEWDENLRAFTNPIKVHPKNPKLHGVKLNISISKENDNELGLGESGEIEKAIKGIYKKNKENDRLGRSGKQYDYTKIKPTGEKGLFKEPVYDQFKGDPLSAAEFLEIVQSGHLKGVWNKNGVDIDLVWGYAKITDKGDHVGKGLAHIIDKHVNYKRDFQDTREAIEKITYVIKNGKPIKPKAVVKHNDNNITLITPDKYKVVIARTKNSRWILTAYHDIPDSKKGKGE